MSKFILIINILISKQILLNTKIIVGHYHSPGRKDGAIAVGTSTHLRVGYNNGPSSWLQSHVIIHNNGKAQHINFIDGEFTVKRMQLEKDCLYLMPENSNYSPIKVTEENQLIIWGIVTYVIKKV